MNIIIDASSNITCVDLTALLGLTVLKIIREQNDVQIKLDATEAQITADHRAVLAQVFDGQIISVEVVA